MTLLDLLKGLLRRWPLAMAGTLVTVAIAYFGSPAPAVYYTRAEVQFLAPASTDYPNPLQTKSEDIIIAAGAVARRINGPEPVAKFASPEVTLVGLGVRKGWALRLPDTGGQWASHYARQAIVLEVVDPDERQLRVQLAASIARVEEQLGALQDELGVEPINRITTAVYPDQPMIHRVGGSRIRAAGMILFLGALVTVSVVVLLERRPWRT